MIFDKRCLYCGEGFNIKNGYKAQKYCSTSCSTAYKNTNRIWTEEGKLKISIANTGRLSGNKNPNYQGNSITSKCKKCSVVFEIPFNEFKAKKRTGVFCSTRCYQEHRAAGCVSSNQDILNRRFRRCVCRFVKITTSHTNSKWFKHVGYTPTELKTHLESLFLDGMSWGNYAKGGKNRKSNDLIYKIS